MLYFGLLCLLLSPAEAPAPIVPLIVSPRIQRLRVDVATDRRAEQQFWAEVERAGAPLVERAPEPGYSIVTFLWRGLPDTRNVVVHGDGTPGDPASNQFSLLPGTVVWYRSERYRSGARFRYSISPNDDLRRMESVPPAEFAKRIATFVGDPLNPRKSSGPIPMADLSLPEAPKQSFVAGPAPPLENRAFRDWPLHIYRPAGIDGPLPMLLLFDGSSYADEMRAPTTAENLIRAGRIRPLMLVMIENPPGKRNVELTCNEEFTKMLATELAPWLRAYYHVSDAPFAVGGMSYGGLAAAFAALRYPRVFDAVLSQSGSYWWKPREAPDWAWLVDQYRAAPRPATRFYIEVGLMENGKPGGRPSMIEANRGLRDVLRLRDVPVTYSEFDGDHTALNWRGSFADGLIALFGK